MLNRTDISFFSLDILRRDKRQTFSRDFSEGDAFQQLCFDLLTREFKDKGIRLTLYPTKARDGGVDISGEDSNHNKIIIECKKNNTPQYAQNALNELKNTLEESLRKPDAPGSLYSPWFNPDFQQYIYCVSCTFPTEHERENFKNKIKDMLHSLSHIDGLKHLQQVAEKVELYSWDNLKPILENNPFLYHKWIEVNFIEGVETVSKPINPKAPRYKDYLNSEKLKYFSRDDYRRENPEAVELVTETEILEELLHRDRYGGCIIYGEGGIGKTRMMVELAARAENQEWIVYKITNKLKSLVSLRDWLYPGSNHLLVFDYIEENPLFAPDILEQLYDLYPDANIKVIGNCRKTYIDISELMESEAFLKVNVSLKDRQRELDYKNYVVGNILGDLQRFFKVDKSFYELRPSFAVFLRFLNEEYKEEEELDFRNVGSFREWLKKRLRLTFGVESYKELSLHKERFYLFYILPSTGALTDNLCSNYNDIILALKKDGWLEDDENLLGKDEYKNELRVIHDTIAEEILIFRLEDHRELLKNEIKEIFDYAIANHSFENCFRLFERISHWFVNEEFHTREEISRHSLLFYELFSQYIDRCQHACEPLRDLLTRTSLMGEESIVTLLVEKANFFKESIQSRVFGLRLALKMKYFSKNDSSVNIKDKVRILLDMWLAANHDFLKYRYLSVRVIADFLKLFDLGDHLGPKGKAIVYAKKWLEEFYLTIEAEFLIKSCLDAGGEKEMVKEYIPLWLKKFPLEMETSFVIKSWLNAKGDKEIIIDYILHWLKKFPLEMETHFVIKSWLDAVGEKEMVKEYIPSWLKKFPLEKETSFVIKSWLDAKGEKEMVKDYIPPWLKKFPLEMETSFVIKSWLDAGGERELVKEYIPPWLKKFLLEMKTSFVIQSWLDAGGERELVKEYIPLWLKKFPLEKETSFVIQSWLDAGGKKEMVKEYIAPWLKKFPLEMETRFVIKFWLDAGGEKELVKEYIAPWLKKFPLEMETSFIIKSWLEARGDRELVKKYIKPWLSKFPFEEKDTSFVLRAWLNAEGERQEVESFVMQWLEKFHNSFEASYVIRAWLKNTKDPDSIKTYALQWLQAFKDHPEADFVIKRFCKYEDIPADFLDAAIHLYKKYINTSEALYTLSYLTRGQIKNEKISGQWLLDDLGKWIDSKSLINVDIRNLEIIQYNISNNIDFCYSPGGIALTIKWFLSKNSFHPISLNQKFSFIQQPCYFERYCNLFEQRLIDISVNVDKVKEFLHWVNGWLPENKELIKRNIEKLKNSFPQYNHLWEMVHLD
jgi:hypothetical protein